MFLRRQRKTVDSVHYDYWTLCESVRTEKGPRQRIVANLGKLTPTEAAGSRASWNAFASLLEGKSCAQSARQLELGENFTDHDSDAGEEQWEMANLRGIRVERMRDFGEVWLGLALWRRLGLHHMLGDLIEPGNEDIPWQDIAEVLCVARFCSQRSELAIAEHWYTRTALEDITGIPAPKINDDRLYRGLDVLAAHKDKLCSHLMRRYEDWFGVQFEFLVYDVTSTFFEGQADSNDKAARGYSRDMRSDCKQVCIGLVCTPEGLPLSFEVFAGNRNDVTTVEEIVTKMEDTYGKAERIWVMDRGMVSEDNINFLRARNARYLVGTPKSQLKKFEQQLLDKNGWHDVQPGLEARIVDHPDGDGTEKYVLCRSTARAGKERAMLQRQIDNLTAELQKIDTSLKKRPQSDTGKIERRIGRWLGKYPAAAKLISAKVEKDKESGEATGLKITTDQTKHDWTESSHGAYLLRTNCDETDPAQLWKWYVQLTEAEAAFRTAKSDLKLRPVYHQKTERVEAHILVCFLSLAMWRVLEQWMHGKGLGTCARRLIDEISTIKSMDVVVPVRRGDENLEIAVRTISKPERHVAELLTRLELKLPATNQILAPVSAENRNPET